GDDVAERHLPVAAQRNLIAAADTEDGGGSCGGHGSADLRAIASWMSGRKESRNIIRPGAVVCARGPVRTRAMVRFHQHVGACADHIRIANGAAGGPGSPLLRD